MQMKAEQGEEDTATNSRDVPSDRLSLPRLSSHIGQRKRAHEGYRLSLSIGQEEQRPVEYHTMIPGPANLDYPRCCYPRYRP